MKTISLVILLFLSFCGCEKDDICIDPITPDFIIRFRDILDASKTKAASNLQIKNIDIDSIYRENIDATDSITIPLNVNQTSSTYVLSINSTDTNLINSDTLTINYSLETVFVGRACGFKTVFNTVVISLTADSDNWIKSILSSNSPLNVTTQTKAHVEILH